jgi:hypothetical protein
MQMKEKEGQSRLVPVHNLRDEFAVYWLNAKQNLYGFGPRSIDFFSADVLVAVSECKRTNRISFRHALTRFDSV